MFHYQPPRVLVQQAAEQWPVTLALVKAHCRIQHDIDDAYLQHLIAVAVDYIEQGADITLPITRYRYSLDEWPADCRLALPRTPVRLVSGFNYTDTAGELQSLGDASPGTRLLGTNGRVVLGASRPSDCAPDQPLSIDYTAGYGDLEIAGEVTGYDYGFPVDYGDAQTTTTDVLQWPMIAIQGVMIGVQHFYENREAVVIGTISGEMPQSFAAVIARLRVRGL